MLFIQSGCNLFRGVIHKWRHVRKGRRWPKSNERVLAWRGRRGGPQFKFSHDYIYGWPHSWPFKFRKSLKFSGEETYILDDDFNLIKGPRISIILREANKQFFSSWEWTIIVRRVLETPFDSSVYACSLITSTYIKKSTREMRKY